MALCRFNDTCEAYIWVSGTAIHFQVTSHARDIYYEKDVQTFKEVYRLAKYYQNQGVKIPNGVVNDIYRLSLPSWKLFIIDLFRLYR